MSAHILLNALNKLRKIDKMQGLPNILTLFQSSFVGPTSAINIGPMQLCSWDQRGTNMMAPRRANVWANVGSMSYPRLQNKICIYNFI